MIFFNEIISQQYQIKWGNENTMIKTKEGPYSFEQLVLAHPKHVPKDLNN